MEHILGLCEDRCCRGSCCYILARLSITNHAAVAWLCGFFSFKMSFKISCKRLDELLHHTHVHRTYSSVIWSQPPSCWR